MKNIYFRQTFNWIKQKKIFFLLLLICLLTVAGTCIYLRQFSTPALKIRYYVSKTDQVEGWETYLLQNGQKIPLHTVQDIFSLFSDYPFQTYYTSHVITEDDIDCVLRISTDGHNICVFLDQNLFYPSSSLESVSLENVAFSNKIEKNSSYIYLSLTKEHIGKTLTIAQNQPDILQTGFLPCTISSSSWDGYLGETVSSVIRSAFVICLIIVASILAIFLFLLESYHGYYDWSTLLFAFSGLLWMTDYSLSLPEISVLHVISSGNLYLFYRQFYMISLFFFLYTKLTLHKNIYFLLISCIFATMLTACMLGSFQDILPLVSVATFCMLLLTFLFLYIEKRNRNLFADHFFLFLRILCVIVILFVVVTWFFQRERLIDIILLFWSHAKLGNFQLYNRLIAVFIMAFCTFETFLAIQHRILRRKLAIQSLELKQQHSEESFHYLNSYLKQTSMLRHDMHHHFSVLHYYLKNQKIQEASSYLDELIQCEKQIVPYVQTKHSLINMLINSWLFTLNEKNIDLHFENLTAPQVLPISSPDLCSLLSNLFRNALEACEQAPPGENAFLTLEMYTRKNFFVIFCKNSYYQPLKRDKHGHLISTKESPDNHGFGLYIIEEITEKYHGIFDVQADGATFAATLALPLSQK